MENTQSKDILKKISHKYHVAITQTFKCVEDAHKPLDEKVEKFRILLEDEEDTSSTEKALKKLLKAMNDVDKLKSKKGERGGKIIFKFDEEAVPEKDIDEPINECIPISDANMIPKDDFLEINDGNALVVDMTEKESKIISFFFETFLFPERIKNLLKMTIVYFFSLFEAFLKDFLVELFVIKPEIMKSKAKTLDNEKITEFNSIKELHYYLASQIVNDLGYKNIDEINQFLEKKFKINLGTDFPLWDSFRENYYRRNIIVHNSGRISEIYIEKMNLDQSKIGKELPIEFDYIKNCYHSIHKLISFIKDEIIQKIRLD